MEQRFHRMRMIALATGVAIGSANAMEWNPMNWFKPKRVQTLVICGNVAQQRLLAEVAQRESNETFLMLAPEPNGDVYVMMPDFKATRASESQIAELVDVIGPQRVIIIGDSFYFPQAAADQLEGKYPVMMIKGDDWRKNATALEQGMELPKLSTTFNETLLELESELALPDTTPSVVPLDATLPPLPEPRSAEGAVHVKAGDEAVP